jgi:hypothetical protein
MFYSQIRVVGGMVSVFRQPALRLGVDASDVMETFYQALQPTLRLNLDDLLSFGGNSYADLKLTIRTFGGGGRIDITPGALSVELGELPQNTGYAGLAKDHLQLCEDTLRKALKSVEISQRSMRTHLWLACEGGSEGVEAFLGAKGNAALKLDQGAYAGLKKEFTLKFSALDPSKATNVGFALERSLREGDLFVAFDHMHYGSPDVTQTVVKQFGEAETDLYALMLHVGLEPKRDDA